MKYLYVLTALLVLGVPFYYYYGERVTVARTLYEAPRVAELKTPTTTTTKTALFAGGCFWCVESDFEKVPGVVAAVSGYAGGSIPNPTYETYHEGNPPHREVVEVTYDPAQVRFEQLVAYGIKHWDPTDSEGSFFDRGYYYSPAIYVSNPEEREQVRAVIAQIEAMKVYSKPIVVAVEPRPQFWPAEEYHQDYAKKNPLKYSYYRSGSGRDAFIKKHWGESAGVLNDEQGTTSATIPTSQPMAWKSYKKPEDKILQEQLTPLQYKVTQHEGTEPPFQNEYDKENRPGIFVDVLSGEPLFSSVDKFDSGTGWPSFVKPITEDAVKTKTDWYLLYPRTEVRSVYADSHLGHVFDDGPVDRGGKRYCMNSASMRFIPKEAMEKEGYGSYLPLVQ